MIIDYYFRDGIPLDKIKARGDVASYTIMFYRYTYTTDAIFRKGVRNYGYPDYEPHYIGGISFCADKFDPEKWSGTVTCPSRTGEGTRVVHSIFNDSDPGMGHNGTRWSEYYRKISSGSSR